MWPLLADLLPCIPYGIWAKPHKLRKPLVAVESMSVKKSTLAIAGRYMSCRDLTADYDVYDTVVGCGISGPIHLASSKVDGRQYAVKSFEKAKLTPRQWKDLKNETEVYLSLDHPQIAQLHMVFETDHYLHLVMEYMQGGQLFERLQHQSVYTEESAAVAMYQMLLAVAYLHARNIAHRDLKPENFMYAGKSEDHLKLIDFGLAKFQNVGTVMCRACGSLYYMAPEVLEQSYTVQADMWSLGIVAYSLLTGTMAYTGSDDAVLEKIRLGQPDIDQTFSKLSEGAKSFVQALLVKDPEDRLTVGEALEHPWIMERHCVRETHIDGSILGCLRAFSQASQFRRAALCMMAWSLSTEEQAELQEQFLLIDTPKTGTITLTGLQAVLQETFQVDGAEAQRLFSSLHADNSEDIEYTEFLAAALIGRVRTHEDVLRRTFEAFDRHRNGHISADDLCSILGDPFRRTDVEEMMHEVDISGKGTIDYDEFLAYLLNAKEPEPEPAAKEGDAISRQLSLQLGTQSLGGLIDHLMSSPHGEPTVEDEANLPLQVHSASEPSHESYRRCSKGRRHSCVNRGQRSQLRSKLPWQRPSK